MKKNPHQFIERLLARTMGKEQDSGILIKPAITPDVLPEAYHLPEREQQQFSIRSPSILPSPSPPTHSPSIPSDSQEAPVASLGSSPSQDSSKLPKHTPDVPEEENTIPPNDLRTDDTSALSFQEDDIQSFETNVEKHNGESTKVSKDKDKEKDKNKNKNKNKKTDRQIISSEESNKLDQKRKIIYPEKVYKQQQHVPSQLEYAEGSPASNVKNQKGNQIKQSQEGSLLSPVSPEIYHPMQVTRQRQNLETSQRYSEEPSVTINIGRIDVRATIPQKPSTKTQQQFPPSLSLKDYLKHRSEVSR